ncbi:MULTISPECIES: hypothetical protein [Sorangium]|uniref:hypothetical protein n=1 Tax=Sorangium TaxID=39643 RepID=UPI003D9C6844
MAISAEEVLRKYSELQRVASLRFADSVAFRVAAMLAKQRTPLPSDATIRAMEQQVNASRCIIPPRR